MILLLTHSQDYFTIDRVGQALAEMGQPFLRVNTDLFPLEHQLLAGFGNGHPQFEMRVGPQSVDLSQVSAIWCRRLWPGTLPPGLPAEVEAQCARTARTFYFETLSRLEEARWLNPIEAGRRAESKLLQLDLAGQVGLRVPPTLVTNRPEEVKDFFAFHGRIITKLLEPTVQSMQADARFAYTCLVEAEHLETMQSLRIMPQIFQPFLAKKQEFRVVVVGERFLAGGLEIPGSGPLAVDWRQATPDDGLQWFEVDLEQEVQAKVLELMRRLELRFGVLDFIDTGEGEPYFLEINQAGEWGMLERDLGLPISQAIAQELAL